MVFIFFFTKTCLGFANIDRKNNFTNWTKRFSAQVAKFDTPEHIKTGAIHIDGVLG